VKVTGSNPVACTMNTDIDECIKAIRARIRYGHNQQQIAEGLGKHFSQDLLFLCYHAAKILEDAAKEKK
jgi:regulator of sirC expression with transglutaminase-like and TPR domain